MTKVFVTVDEIQLPARFIDARFDLADSKEGNALYNEEHVLGAVYFDLEQHLSDMTKKAGRHPMPEKEDLIDLFESVGLTLQDTIYIYDQGGAPFATRAWWMLTYTGFKNVYIVNGGFSALKEAGFEMETGPVSYERSKIIPQWNEESYASREYVKAITIGETEALLVDARAAARYRGEIEPLDPIAGHIPTAQNFDWERVKQGDTLAPTEELLQAVPKEDEIIVYCGSGVTASPLYAVLKEAGYEKVRLYVGSYSDWITEHEVEKG